MYADQSHSVTQIFKFVFDIIYEVFSDILLSLKQNEL